MSYLNIFGKAKGQEISMLVSLAEIQENMPLLLLEKNSVASISKVIILISDGWAEQHLNQCSRGLLLLLF